MSQMEFEWDDQKEKENIKKHGIDFTTAAHVFSDEFRIEKYDDKHSQEEDRYLVIGIIHEQLAVVTVVYTPRRNVIRMISARIATKEEKEEYYNGYS